MSPRDSGTPQPWCVSTASRRPGRQVTSSLARTLPLCLVAALPPVFLDKPLAWPNKSQMHPIPDSRQSPAKTALSGPLLQRATLLAGTRRGASSCATPTPSPIPSPDKLKLPAPVLSVMPTALSPIPAAVNHLLSGALRHICAHAHTHTASCTGSPSLTFNSSSPPGQYLGPRPTISTGGSSLWLPPVLKPVSEAPLAKELGISHMSRHTHTHTRSCPQQGGWIPASRTQLHTQRQLRPGLWPAEYLYIFVWTDFPFWPCLLECGNDKERDFRERHWPGRPGAEARVGRMGTAWAPRNCSSR